jgi:hypothetical protein
MPSGIVTRIKLVLPIRLSATWNTGKALAVRSESLGAHGYRNVSRL